MSDQTPWETRNILSREKPFTTGELAELFNVNPRTVTRWAVEGRIEHFKTLGGHRRFLADEVLKYFVKYKKGNML